VQHNKVNVAPDVQFIPTAERQENAQIRFTRT